MTELRRITIGLCSANRRGGHRWVGRCAVKERCPHEKVWERLPEARGKEPLLTMEPEKLSPD